jgi:predicted KAP-like P-loop ATPase
MDLANVLSNSKVSQLLAMVLLENARFSPDTLQGAKLLLVQKYQQRTNASSSSTTEVAKKYSRKCTEILAILKNLQQNGSNDDDDCYTRLIPGYKLLSE